MKKTLPALVAAMLALCIAGAGAADARFLADRHADRGFKCETCHDKDMKIRQNGDYDVCTTCHGDYARMIARTEGRHETNPHAQHEGALPCAECHKGHKEGVNYCGGCHNFVFKVP